jgi:DNA repair exonuclease SbcCD ATPase subunit
LELTHSELFARINELEHRLAGVIKSRSEIVAKLAKEGETIMVLKSDKVGVERQLMELKNKHEMLVAQIRNGDDNSIADNSGSDDGTDVFCNSCLVREDELNTAEQENKMLRTRVEQSATEIRSLSKSRATLMAALAEKDLVLQERQRAMGQGSDQRLKECQGALREARLALSKAERQLVEQAEHCTQLETALGALKADMARHMGADGEDKGVLDLYEREQYLAADEEAVANDQRKLEDREAHLTKWQGDLQSKSDEVKTSTIDLQQKIQHYNERVRTLNTSTKEFKKNRKESLSSNNGALVNAAQQEGVIADLNEKLGAALANDSGPAVEARQEALGKAEKDLTRGKEELAKKVVAYNERVRLLNEATKNLKEKRRSAVRSP